MNVVAFLGVSDVTLGTVFGVVWIAILGAAAYRFRSGSLSKKQFYVLLSAAMAWLSYSLLQISGGFGGPAETALLAGAVGSFGVGIGAGIRWWQLARTGTDTDTPA